MTRQYGKIPLQKNFDWDLYRFLLAVAQHGGVLKAARPLGVSQPTVGRKIKELEDQLGVQLFDRTPSGFRLTERGEEVVARAEAIAHQIDAAWHEVQGADMKLEGPVYVTLTEAMAQTILLPALTRFRRIYPGIELQLRISNRKLDLNRREADIAIRVGDPGVEDLIGCSVGHMTYGLYGTDSYLGDMGKPNSLEALSDHPVIYAEGEIVDLPQAVHLRQLAPTAPVALCCDTLLAQYHAMLCGVGLAPLPEYVATMGEGRCRRVLESDFVGVREIWLLTSENARRSTCVRAVMNFMKLELRTILSRRL